jgi:hypothetical protein
MGRGWNKLTAEQVIDRIKEVHGDTISIDISTYVNTSTKCRFIDIEYGEYWSLPNDVLAGCVCLMRGNDRISKSKAISMNDIEERIRKIHGNLIKLDRDTYKDVSSKCRFVDVEFGEYWTTPHTVLKGSVCRKRSILNRRATNISKYGTDYVLRRDDIKAKAKNTLLSKYGVTNPTQNRDIALRAAKTSNKSVVLYHWKTGEEVVCIGSYEVKTVEFLNANQIEFMWQPRTFRMPTEGGKVKTFRPDLYLCDSELWVEIKGYFRGDALEKWEWFHSLYRKSELWDTSRLKEFGIL